MPITPNDLRRITRPLDFTYVGQPVHIEYRPAAFGSDALAQWNAIAEEVNAAAGEEETRAASLGFGHIICDILAAWDYCENPDPAEPDGPPGPPVPLTPERIVDEMMRYPLFFPDFLQAILLAITEAVTQGNASGTPSSVNSEATSPSTASSGSSRASRKPSGSRSSRAGSAAAARR